MYLNVNVCKGPQAEAAGRAAGLPIAEIARRTGLARNMIKARLRSDDRPDRYRHKAGARKIDARAAYLRRPWRPFGPIASYQPLDLPYRQLEPSGRLRLRQLPLRHVAHDRRSVQLTMTHRQHIPVHGPSLGVCPKGTL